MYYVPEDRSWAKGLTGGIGMDKKGYGKRGTSQMNKMSKTRYLFYLVKLKVREKHNLK